MFVWLTMECIEPKSRWIFTASISSECGPNICLVIPESKIWFLLRSVGRIFFSGHRVLKRKLACSRLTFSFSVFFVIFTYHCVPVRLHYMTWWIVPEYFHRYKSSPQTERTKSFLIHKWNTKKIAELPYDDATCLCRTMSKLFVLFKCFKT